ncbi:MAG: tryptophan synthase subunit alpha [Chthoniobacterales bacterium]
MENRIDQRFAALQKSGKKGFVAYISAGDPNLDATLELALEFDRIGVDVLELGIPFSDPLADGVVNQSAAQRALDGGSTLPKILETIKKLRKQCEIPIVLFTYLNPIYAYGYEKFHKDAAAAGVDGMLVLDMPHDEEARNSELHKTSSLRMIRLIAPTTSPERMTTICGNAEGFIYYVSREGVTGEQTQVSGSISAQIEEIRRHTKLPIAVGFGISTPEQAGNVASQADAVVVGSAIVRRIGEQGKSATLISQIGDFVRPLVDAVKSAS